MTMTRLTRRWLRLHAYSGKVKEVRRGSLVNKCGNKHCWQAKNMRLGEIEVVLLYVCGGKVKEVRSCGMNFDAKISQARKV
jgi:hypothetical protein